MGGSTDIETEEFEAATVARRWATTRHLSRLRRYGLMRHCCDRERRKR